MTTELVRTASARLSGETGSYQFASFFRRWGKTDKEDPEKREWVIDWPFPIVQNAVAVCEKGTLQIRLPSQI